MFRKGTFQIRIIDERSEGGFASCTDRDIADHTETLHLIERRQNLDAADHTATDEADLFGRVTHAG